MVFGVFYMQSGERLARAVTDMAAGFVNMGAVTKRGPQDICPDAQKPESQYRFRMKN